MLAFHLYLPWVSEIRFHIWISWKTFFQRHIFIRIYLFCVEYFYHSLPQKEGERRDTQLVFCRQDFFELKPQMLTFSLPWTGLGTNCIANLYCVVYQLSITQDSTGVCLPEMRSPSAHEICTWSWFRARMSGLNLQHQVKWQYTIWGPGRYIPATLEKSCISECPEHHLHLSKNYQMWNQPIEHLFFIYFSCLQNFFLPSIPLEPGEGLLLWQMYILSIFPLGESHGPI